MNFSQQLKKYRSRDGLSQEELAEKIYVTRQTISKWENDKTYPDIHNLIALSILFDITLDDLIKGDVKKMKEDLALKEMNKYTYVMLITIVAAAVIFGPAVLLSSGYGVVISFILWGIGMYAALKVEKIKKDKNIKTFKEIVAYTEGENVEVERAKRHRIKDVCSKTLIVMTFTIAAVTIMLLSMGGASFIMWLISLFK